MMCESPEVGNRRLRREKGTREIYNPISSLSLLFLLSILLFSSFLSLESKLYPKDYPVHITFFKEAGLRLPFRSLLIDFLRVTHLTLGQLTPNVPRIVLGIDELNRIHCTHLGLDELKFCYTLSRRS